MAAPDNIFANLIPNSGATSPAVYGAPPAAEKPPALPQGWEPDPDSPGAIRPIKGGPSDPNATGILDDKTKDFFAQQVLTGSPMPSIGFGKEAARAKQDIMNRVAKMAGAQDMSGTDFAAQIAHFKAGQAALTKMQTMHDQIRASEETAIKNGRQFLETSQNLPLQTETPIVNSLVQFGQRNIGAVPGHKEIAAADVAYQTFANEYAKVVAGSPSGAGVLSDSARKEAQDVLRSNAGPEQKKAALSQMEKDMQNRMDAINAVIQDGYKNITRRYDQYSVPEDPANAPLPASWVKTHPESIAAAVAGTGGGNKGDGGGGNNGGSGGPPGAPGTIKLTPDQESSYAAFWKATPNPTPEQLTTFLGGIGVNNVQNAADIIKAAQTGRGYSTTEIKTDYQNRLKQRIKQEDALGDGETPAQTLVAHGDTLGLSDEAAGVGNAAANAVLAPFSRKVNFDPVGSYQFGRDAERMRIDNARQQLGYGGSAIEFGSSLATGNPAGALEAITPRAATAVGALAGFGNGEGASDSATQTAVGALGGYAVGRYAEPVLNAVGRGVSKVVPSFVKTRALPSQGLAPDVAAAAQAEGVDMIRPMVDPASRGKYAALESNPASQSTIRQGFNRTLGQIEDRVKSLGGGTPFAESAQGGEAVQQGGKNWLTQRTTMKNRLYRQAEEKSAGAQLVPQKAIGEADSIISDLKGVGTNTNAAEITWLQGIRDDLAAPGGKTVEQIRKIREGLRQGIKQNGLTMDGAGVRALQILNAAKQDIADNVPNAAQAYNRADQYYAASQGVVDDLEATILGTREKPIDPQVALKNLRGMMSDTGTGRRYARIMQSLDSDTRQDVAATWASALGRDAPDAPFQLGKFLGQTRGLSPSALRTAFGPEGAESVKNLRVLSQSLQAAGKDINYSRSGSVVAALAKRLIGGVTGLGTVGALTTHSITGAGAGAAAGIALGAKSDVQAILSARAMVNPRVSRWLAETANVTNRSQAHAALRKLSVVIAREPALAAELTPIYSRISAGLGQRLDLPLAANPDQSGNGNNE